MFTVGEKDSCAVEDIGMFLEEAVLTGEEKCVLRASLQWSY